MSMVVVQVVPTPSGGGAEVVARALHRGLLRRGVTSYCVFFDNPSHEPLADNEFCLATGKNPIAAVAALRRRLAQLNDEHFNPLFVMHAHLTGPLFVVPLAMLGRHGHLIWTEHNTYNRRRALPFGRFLDQAIYNRFGALVCNSNGTLNALAAWLRDQRLEKRMLVVENGSRLFLQRPSLPVDTGNLRLLSIGSLTHQKGFDVAIRSVAILREHVEEYVILGEGPERLSLEKLIASLGLQNVVQLRGWCPDIAAALEHSHICLIPSRWEGFGLVAVEALSAGVPVVATSVPGLAEVTGGCQACELVSPGDSENLAAGILALAARMEAEPRSTLDASRRRAEQYGFERMVDRYVEVYRNVITPGCSPARSNE